MNTRRIPILVTAVGLVLAACGGSDPASTTAADPEPVATEAAASADNLTDGSDTTAEPTDTQVPSTDTPSTDAPTIQPSATEPSATEVPPPAEPEPAPVGGRAFSTTVESASQFDDNPFPDLVVDDIGRDGEANIANILPSDRPVLLWTWAPH